MSRRDRAGPSRAWRGRRRFSFRGGQLSTAGLTVSACRSRSRLRGAGGGGLADARGRPGRDGRASGDRRQGANRGAARVDQQQRKQLQFHPKERQGERHHQPANRVVDEGVDRGVLDAGLEQHAGQDDAGDVGNHRDGNGAGQEQGLVGPRPADGQHEGRGQGEEDDQHPQAAARLDDADLVVVEEDDVAVGQGGQAEQLHHESAAQSRKRTGAGRPPGGRARRAAGS